MHNIIAKSGFLSPCRRIPDSDDYEILDCSYFEKTDANIEPHEHICCVTQLPTKQNFFYKLSSYENGRIVQSEYGIGEIYKYKGRKTTALKREFVIKRVDSTGPHYSANHKPRRLNPKAEYFVVNTYIPENYIETYITPNSVLCSVERFDPTPVELEDNSVLGRLNDKIQSIDGAELREILESDRPVVSNAEILTTVTKSKKPLILATNRVELTGNNSRIACDHIFLRPGARPSKPRLGFLHYNDGLDCLEVFTSQGWRSVTTPTG